MSEKNESTLFRKKPVVVQAVQYPCEHPALQRCTCDANSACSSCGREFIQTLEGRMNVSPGDWIITGVQGEHYPCKPDIFAATYEPAAAPGSTSSAPGDAQDEQARHKMNADLCAFYMRWEADGDYLRCRKCKRPQIASYAEKGFPHAAGCKAVGNVEQCPWLALIELMRPLIGSAAPAAGDALELTLSQKYEDACIAANANARDAARYRFIRDVPYTDEVRRVMSLQQNAIMDDSIDAALAAQVPQQGEA